MRGRADRGAPRGAWSTSTGFAVALPPGAFLQATRDAEAAIRAAVRDAIGDAPRIADLFAGCGTLGLPLAAAGRRGAGLDADGDARRRAGRRPRTAGCGDRFTTATRDLERAPLAGAELDRFDAVILDPPRAGARAQAQALAGRAGGAHRDGVVQPRDLRARRPQPGRRRLALAWVRPVDAFLWSTQIELVGAFARA